MDNERIAKNYEMETEEVNVYDVNCGQVRHECVTDCIMATCFFSCDQ